MISGVSHFSKVNENEEEAEAFYMHDNYAFETYLSDC
jgi:hypothetical protein